jgi:hypothetical protein
MSRPECPKEDKQQSEFSPGKVEDSEPIVYALIDPLTAAQGSLKEFSNSGLKKGTVSVCRASHCTAEEARREIVGRVREKAPDRTFQGAVWTSALEIRTIRLGTFGIGAFCVIDDGDKDYNAHALLSYSEVTDLKIRNERQVARGDLYDLFMKNGKKENWSDCPFRAAGSTPGREGALS